MLGGMVGPPHETISFNLFPFRNAQGLLVDNREGGKGALTTVLTAQVKIVTVSLSSWSMYN